MNVTTERVTTEREEHLIRRERSKESMDCKYTRKRVRDIKRDFGFVENEVWRMKRG